MKKELTPEQELFIQLYTTQGDTFSNGVISYARAYGFELPELENGYVDTKSSEYKTCKASASRLLTLDYIIARKRELLVALFNDDTVIDARLNEIVLNGKDTDAIQAIKHRNDLKQRVTKKLDVTTQGRPLAHVSDEELLKLAGE